jgi:hypothetical protein
MAAAALCREAKDVLDAFLFRATFAVVSLSKSFLGAVGSGRNKALSTPTGYSHSTPDDA